MSFSGKAYRILVDLIYEHSRIRLGADKQTLLARHDPVPVDDLRDELHALSRGMIGAGLTVTAAMALGMIATIGGIALAAAFARDRLMSLLAKTEGWRDRVGFVLEIGSSILVVAFGALTLINAISR